MYTIIERVLDLLAILAQEKGIASHIYPPPLHLLPNHPVIFDFNFPKLSLFLNWTETCLQSGWIKLILVDTTWQAALKCVSVLKSHEAHAACYLVIHTLYVYGYICNHCVYND